MDNIIKIVESLENLLLLNDSASDKIKKKKKVEFLAQRWRLWLLL